MNLPVSHKCMFPLESTVNLSHIQLISLNRSILFYRGMSETSINAVKQLLWKTDNKYK